MIIKKENFNYIFDDTFCGYCGAKCCKGNGYVLLHKDEIESISEYLKRTVDEFIKFYTKKAEYGKKTTLIDLKINGETKCVFLDENNRCEIYEVRPKQCKTFPFWNSLKNKNIKELQNLCPGSSPCR